MKSKTMSATQIAIDQQIKSDIEAILRTKIGQFLLIKQAGQSITFEWNGGSDEGGGQIYINGSSLLDDDDIDVTYPLEDLLLSELGYGGFDGDFSTSGELTFDPETLCFKGYDDHETNEWETIDANLHLLVPTDIYYNEIVIQFVDDSVQVQLRVNNGPYTQRHVEIEKMIKGNILDFLWELDNHMQCMNVFSFRLKPEDFSQPIFQCTIDKLSVLVTHVDTRDVTFSLLENMDKFLINESEQ